MKLQLLTNMTKKGHGMRLSIEHVQELQRLLKTEFGLECDHEQAQQAGFAIMRFVVAKHRRTNQLTDKEDISDEIKQESTNSI